MKLFKRQISMRTWPLGLSAPLSTSLAGKTIGHLQENSNHYTGSWYLKITYPPYKARKRVLCFSSYSSISCEFQKIIFSALLWTSFLLVGKVYLTPLYNTLFNLRNKQGGKGHVFTVPSINEYTTIQSQYETSIQIQSYNHPFLFYIR